METKRTIRENAPVKDFDKGWTYYVVLDEMNVRICPDEEEGTQPKRFLSVAAAEEWAKYRVGLFSVLEMNARQANKIIRHIAIKLH